MREEATIISISIMTSAFVIGLTFSPVKSCSNEATVAKLRHQRDTCESACNRTKYERDCFVACMRDYKFHN